MEETWHSKLPLMVKNLIKNRIQNVDNLGKKSWQGINLCQLCVTPRVSKPHDYANHMFMRLEVLIKFEI
jgi:hypothetical protein